MNLRRGMILRAALVGLLATAAAAVAWGQAVNVPEGYEIIQITSGPEYDHDPRMNSRGQVVFTRQTIPGNNSTMEIMLWDNGKLIQLTDDNNWQGGPDINNDGVITWSTADEAKTVADIVVLRQGELTRITSGGINTGPRINDAGHIVWRRRVGSNCAGAVDDLFFYDGQAIRRITSNAVPDGVTNSQVALNNQDQIVWGKFDWCDPPPPYLWSSRIMMWQNGQTRVLSDQQLGAQSANINHRGQVVWAFDIDFVPHLILWDEGVTTVLAPGHSPGINDRRHVPFLRWDEPSRKWQQWLLRQGTFYLLDPAYAINGKINQRSEMVWQARSGSPLRDDLRLLRLGDTPGDMDCDGVVTTADIDGFVYALLDTGRYQLQYPYCDAQRGDVNRNGEVDVFDIEPFIGLLAP